MDYAGSAWASVRYDFQPENLRLRLKRLFYYSGYRLTVFHWSEGRFSGSYYFEPDEKGREEFRRYLKNSPAVNSRFLVDVIEEDFRRTTIPHVGAQDRKAVIKRQTERYFRNSKQYSYSEYQGREHTGRKDDIVLISALTNPDMVKSWLVILEEENTPICGIYSLPIISKKILGRIDAKSGHVLLISQQVSSNVRQTYFIDGKLITSRSATLNLEGESYGKFISEEIDQTSRFLTNKHFIGFDEVLNVHIITSPEHIESLNAECPETPLRHIQIHELADIEKKVETQGISGPFGNGIFAQLCMEDRFQRPHYGDNSDFRVCNQERLRKSFIMSAIGFVVLAIVYTIIQLIDIDKMQQQEIVYKEQKHQIDTAYIKELQHLEPELEMAEVMKNTVKVVRKINQRRQVSPQRFFVWFSNIFNMSKFSLLRIVEIDWRANIKAEPGNDFINAKVPVQIGDGQLVDEVTVKGMVPIQAVHIRDATDEINALAETIRKQPDVQGVFIQKLPVDVRSSANLSLTTGTESRDSTNNDTSGEFILKVVKKDHIHD